MSHECHLPVLTSTKRCNLLQPLVWDTGARPGRCAPPRVRNFWGLDFTRGGVLLGEGGPSPAGTQDGVRRRFRPPQRGRHDWRVGGQGAAKCHPHTQDSPHRKCQSRGVDHARAENPREPRGAGGQVHSGAQAQRPLQRTHDFHVTVKFCNEPKCPSITAPPRTEMWSDQYKR